MKLLVSAGSLLLAKSLSIICSAFVLALASRRLDQNDLARLALYLSSIALFQPAVRFGLGRALLSRLASETELAQSSTVYRLAPPLIVSAMLAGCIMSVPLLTFSVINAESAANKPWQQIQHEMVFAAFSLVMSSVMQILSDISRGLGRAIPAAFLDAQRGGSFSGIIALSGCLALYFADKLTIEHVLISILCSYLIPVAIIVSAALYQKTKAQFLSSDEAEPISALIRSSLSFWIIDVLAAFLLFGDPWMAAIVLDSDNAMSYYVASQIAGIITFPVGLLSLASITEIVKNYRAGLIDQAEKHARRISALSTIVCIPTICLVLLGSDYIIRDVFNQNSDEAFLPLCLLLSSKAFYVMTGPTSLCLAFLLKGRRAILISALNVTILTSFITLAGDSALSFAFCIATASITQNVIELAICQLSLKIRTHPSLNIKQLFTKLDR